MVVTGGICAYPLGRQRAGLARFCVAVGDARQRGEVTVGELASSEPLLELPLLLIRLKEP